MGNFQQFLTEALRNTGTKYDRDQSKVIQMIFDNVAHDIRNKFAMQFGKSGATNVSLLPAYGIRDNKYSHNVIYVTDAVGSEDGRPHKHSTGIELKIEPMRNDVYKVSFVCRGKENLNAYGDVVRDNGSYVDGLIRNVITTDIEQTDIDTGSQLGFVFKFKIDEDVRNHLENIKQSTNQRKQFLNKNYKESLNLLYKMSNSRVGKDENARLATERALAKVDKDVLSQTNRSFRVKLVKEPAFAKIKSILERAGITIQITKVAVTDKAIVIPIVIDKAKYKLYINPVSIILIDRHDNERGSTVYAYNINAKHYVNVGNVKDESPADSEKRIKEFAKKHNIEKTMIVLSKVDIASLMSYAVKQDDKQDR